MLYIQLGPSKTSLLLTPTWASPAERAEMETKFSRIVTAYEALRVEFYHLKNRLRSGRFIHRQIEPLKFWPIFFNFNFEI